MSGYSVRIQHCCNLLEQLLNRYVYEMHTCKQQDMER
jgi:hypothetical protein